MHQYVHPNTNTHSLHTPSPCSIPRLCRFFHALLVSKHEKVEHANGFKEVRMHARVEFLDRGKRCHLPL